MLVAFPFQNIVRDSVIEISFAKPAFRVQTEREDEKRGPQRMMMMMMMMPGHQVMRLMKIFVEGSGSIHFYSKVCLGMNRCLASYELLVYNYGTEYKNFLTIIWS